MNQRSMFPIIVAIIVSSQYKVSATPPLRIVNGTKAEEGEFPYMVQLQTSGMYACGGGIIGSEWIITAGHCVDDLQIDLIIYGTNKLYTKGDGTPNTTIKVKKSFQHPNFTYIGKDKDIPIYDVGVLQLEGAIPFSATAQPIKLVEANATIPFHVQGVLSGWGVNDTYGSSPPYLRKINLQLLTDEECTKKINDFSNDTSFIATHNVCPDEYYNGGCYGDSGSPYVINGIVYGLDSWGFPPCGIVPEGFTRISNPEYRNWIKNITGI